VILTRVKLLNYRNLREASVEISPKINIFLGRNGQGKTNFLEAVSYLSLGRSHRGAADRELLRFGTEHLNLTVEGKDGQGEEFVLEAALSRQGQKRVRIDGSPIRRTADLVGRLSTVLFDPGEIELVKGGPEHRRRFLDHTLSMVSADYFRNLLGYRRALSQKNRLLKEPRRARDEEIEVWDAELVRHGTPLILARRRILPFLEQVCARSYSSLAPEGGSLTIVLKLSLGDAANAVRGDDLESWQDAFHEALRVGRARERQLGHAWIGPHRDRLELELRGRSLRRYGSQGEMRSAAIALKLGQAELIYERTHERPVILLDDIFSELDHQRTRALQKLLHEEHQLLIATARKEDIEAMQQWSGLRIWEVEEGRIAPVEQAQ